MHVRGKVVVVTGGASGIGRAMVRRFHAEGAAGVLVADLDAPGAEAVAADLGDRALAAPCNVTVEAEVAGLVELAERHFGPVDLFCANAGVGVGTGPESPDADWDLSWKVNVMAHVYAARHLLPGWLARGDGYFLATASAAGLLAQIGSATYSVTKHAAVAFAEWLSITYGDRGVKVSCLCPQGVNTPMLQHHPAGNATAAQSVKLSGTVLEPDEVAGVVVEALADERFLVLPHPQVHEFLRRKADDPDRWLAGMRKLQARAATGG